MGGSSPETACPADGTGGGWGALDESGDFRRLVQPAARIVARHGPCIEEMIRAAFSVSVRALPSVRNHRIWSCHMTLTNDKVISVLNDLIETCEDGIHGFRTAADAVKNPAAKALFISRLPKIELGTSELKAEVRRLGGDPEKRGTVAGAVHRGWIDLKAAVTGKDEDAIINECERGEEHAVKVYENALGKDLPAEIRTIVDRQYRGVVENLERVRALKAAV
jgi:uncharacterized protein (TIGR02284 family)